MGKKSFHKSKARAKNHKSNFPLQAAPKLASSEAALLLTSPLFIGPNPALKGGESLLPLIQGSAKQLAYAAQRRAHVNAWWADNDRWLAEHGVSRSDGPKMGDKE